jgi:hypothetical protein
MDFSVRPRPWTYAVASVVVPLIGILLGNFGDLFVRGEPGATALDVCSALNISAMVLMMSGLPLGIASIICSLVGKPLGMLAMPVAMLGMLFGAFGFMIVWDLLHRPSEIIF